MKLITDAILAKLKANHAKANETGETQPVVLKLFGGSSMTWLITEIEDDGDRMWGLCDIGHGCCEFGTISLSELKALKFPPFNLPVERDRHFRGGSVDEFNKYYEEHNSLNGC
tara:strand:- start:4593 stop:4931 length:339 start_codon:yes stop_codon:yes gene_type:complete